MLQKIALLALCFSSCCTVDRASSSAGSVSQSSPDVATQIKQLEEEKRDLQSRATFAEDEADRLEFQDWMGYREHITEYERYQSEIKLVQEKIDQLKKKK